MEKFGSEFGTTLKLKSGDAVFDLGFHAVKFLLKYLSLRLCGEGLGNAYFPCKIILCPYQGNDRSW